MGSFRLKCYGKEYLFCETSHIQNVDIQLLLQRHRQSGNNTLIIIILLLL